MARTRKEIIEEFRTELKKLHADYDTQAEKLMDDVIRQLQAAESKPDGPVRYIVDTGHTE